MVTKYLSHSTPLVNISWHHVTFNSIAQSFQLTSDHITQHHITLSHSKALLECSICTLVMKDAVKKKLEKCSMNNWKPRRRRRSWKNGWENMHISPTGSVNMHISTTIFPCTSSTSRFLMIVCSYNKHVTWCHEMSWGHVTWCQEMSCDVVLMSCNVTWWSRNISENVIKCYVMSWNVIECHVMSKVIRNVIDCEQIWIVCRVMSRDEMWWHIIT